jgi:type IV fimbrial biogenesis protein FimU
MSRPKASAGFTLIELMIVVVLLAIFASIALPSFSTLMRNNKVQGSADELYILLQFARTEAVSRRATIKIQAPSSATDQWAGDVQVLMGTTILRQLGTAGLGSTVSATGTLGALSFNPVGTASGKGCITVCSTSDTNACRYIAIQNTGRVVAPSLTKGGECS